jgi:multiple sugar transport system substrate-binding protein
MNKKLTAILVSTLLVLSISGCKKQQQVGPAPEQITLTYYKLFENEENFENTFNKFQSQNPNVQIIYKKFVDPERYIETIIDEIAEGGGPDIMSVPNTWIRQNYKKLTPAPETLATPEIYRDLFVDIAAQDNILTDSEGVEKIYGLPLTVDNLALFYNDKHFEEVIPERGKPSTTWTGIVQDVQRLNKQNSSSLDKFDRSGISLGRSDNISRAADVFYLMLMQNDVDFYNKQFTATNFATKNETSDVLKYILSFSDEEQPNYSWNKFIADPTSPEKEVTPFALGKTSMIFGYSSQYKNILNVIDSNKKAGKDTISIGDVKIAPIPQTSLDGERVTLAQYYTETVSRNSKHPEAAWKLITFMAQEDNLEKWYKKDFKPTSLRSLIPKQRSNPIFGTFIEQIGYSRTLPIVDLYKYKTIIDTMITNSIGEEFVRSELLSTQQKLNQIIPNEGAYPIPEGEL